MKYAGRGLVFSREGTPVGQATEVGPAGSTRDLIDASAYGDDWKDYVLGQQDGDEMTLTLAYDPIDAEHVLLAADYDAGVPVTYGLSHDTADFDVEFDALMVSMSRGAPLGGLLTMNCSLKIVNPGVTDATS